MKKFALHSDLENPGFKLFLLPKLFKDHWTSHFICGLILNMQSMIFQFMNMRANN